MEALSKKAKEADVEARVVTPLLTGAQYLAIPHASIRNKAYLYPQRIDKAAGKTTGYYPDFSIWEESLPLCIVEAKAPAVAADVGYREASQYALHLNRQYRTDLDPCSYIIATNGITILAGFWNANPEIDCPVEEMVPGSVHFELLRERVGHPMLRQRVLALRQAIASEGVFSAMKGAKASTLINTKVVPNHFATALIPTLTRYFASPTDDTDPAVYDRGYIATNEQLSYDSILESLLRDKAHSYKNPLSRDIHTTRSESRDLSQRITDYNAGERNTSQLILVVGSVGSGKSLFIRRYRNLLVPASLKDSTLWSFINFNDAFQLDGAKRWVSEHFVESFQKENKKHDIFSEENLEKIFATDLNSNRAIYAGLERVSPVEAAKQKAVDLKGWKSDPETLSKAITRHFSGDRGYTCIAVFDNVDRLDKDDQLAAFQLALGFTAEHRTLTILQLRDETFERYKDTKPLDTFKTGVVFHITPPRFASIVKRRLEISIEDLQLSAPDQWNYELSNGVRVTISKLQALGFLNDIYDYVFGEDLNASRILQGLAGRNVRRALDIFFRVVTSGHLESDQITSIGTGGRSFPITDDLVLRTLMRGDYRFFHSGSGFVSNIFYFESEWIGADNFLLTEILFYLAARLKTRGTIGIEGFFTTDAMFEVLQLLGYPRATVEKACQWLLAKGLVEADSMSTAQLDPGVAIRVSSAGFIHLRVLSQRLEYVAGCLYETPYLTADMADYVGRMFADSTGTGGLSRTRKAQGVQEMRRYLRELQHRRDGIAPNLVGVSTGASYIMEHVEAAIAEAIRPLNPQPAKPDALDL